MVSEGERPRQVECPLNAFELAHGDPRALGKRMRTFQKREEGSVEQKRLFQDKFPEFCSLAWITSFPLSIEAGLMPELEYGLDKPCNRHRP